MSLECNICGCTEFIDLRLRRNAMCKSCKSYERTRVAFLFLQKYDFLESSSRVLHIAPEKGLYDYFREKCGSNYRAVDLHPEVYAGMEVERFDLCSDVFDIDYGTYDLVIHNHVMGHLPCNISAVLVRLTMALRQEGIHMFSIPIFAGCYHEDLSKLSREKRAKSFGQFNHVRRFGIEDIAHSIGMLFRIPRAYDLLENFSEEELMKASIPLDAWQKLSSNTIFSVSRADLRI
jgi:hypothetical protein